MALDEFSAVLRAKAFVRAANPSSIPVPLGPYLKAAGAVVTVESDMGPDESGSCFRRRDGTYHICVNGSHREERQRFTLCHEIAHIVLGLKSDHQTVPWSAGRPLAERLCDLFAAELLLPGELFQAAAEDAPVSLASVDALARRFGSSVVATGSRFAETVSEPVAFVLSQCGKVVHGARSKSLKDAGAFIAREMGLPEGSVSARARAGDLVERAMIDADAWFSSWERGGTLLEEARHLTQWDQTITLLWFEDGDIPAARAGDRREYRWALEGRDTAQRPDDEDELGLKELDGNLRWPGRPRRR